MTQQEYAKVWQVSHLKGLELLQATFTTHSFPKHFHTSYGIGLSDRQNFQPYPFREYLDVNYQKNISIR